MKKIPNIRNVSGVYAIECTINGRKYIGQSKNLGRRYGEHLGNLKRGCHRNKSLQEDFNKYGEEAFEFYIIISGDLSAIELNSCEAEQIAMLGGVDGGICYNVFTGGGAGYTANKEFRRRVSDRFKGTKQSESTKRLKAENARRQWDDPKYRTLMVESAKNQWKSDEYREVMRIAHTGRPEACGHILTAADVIAARKRHDSGEKIKDLAVEYGVSYPAMVNALNGNTWKSVNS